MPNRKSAAKSLRGSVKRQLRNRINKSQAKTAEKKFLACVETGDAPAATEALKACFSTLDKAAKKGTITKNKANRKKGRLNARLGKLAG